MAVSQIYKRNFSMQTLTFIQSDLQKFHGVRSIGIIRQVRSLALPER